MRKPMPLSDLPEYIEHVRRNGQDDVPVVDVGRIIQKKAFSFAKLAAAACLIVGLTGFYIASSTRQITITSSNMDFQEVAKMVNDEGGNVLSARWEEGKYKIRVFTFRKMNLFMSDLSEKARIEGMEVE
jgi:hypothetical protein